MRKIFFGLTISFLLVGSSSAETLLEQYGPLFKKWSTGPIHADCPAPNLKSNKKAWQYRTTIKDYLAGKTSFLAKGESAHFASHYQVLIAGLTGGSLLFIQDCLNQKIYFVDQLVLSLSFHKDSGLMILNPPDKEETLESYKPSMYGPPRAFVWKNNRLKELADDSVRDALIKKWPSLKE